MLLRVIPGQPVTAEPESTDQILQALNSIQTALVLIQADISRLGTRGVAMSMELDRLTTEVSETNTVMDSAITLLNGLSAQIRALKDDPAKLGAVADNLDAKTNELAQALTANTPQTPEPHPPNP